MRPITLLGTTLLALACLAPALEAQTKRTHVGPRISFDFDAEDAGIGAQVGVPIAPRLEFYPSFDVYFVDPGSLWELNADLKYRVSSSRSADWLYVGGGLGIRSFGVGPVDETDVLVNILAGIEPLRGRIHPFAEARLGLGDGSTLQLAAGLNITLGRH